MLGFCLGYLVFTNFVLKAELANTCGPDYFPCNDGSCVEKIKWCDTKLDCEDDSDEQYCYKRSALISNPNRCNETLFFLCGDGECIPRIGRCDGFLSCYDNSDEIDCETVTNVSADLSPKPPTEAAVKELSIQLNTSDLETSGRFNDHENSMQSDSESHTEEAFVKVSAYSMNASNASEHYSSSPGLKQSHHHNALQANLTMNSTNQVSNLTNKDFGINSRFPMNQQEALEFHSLIGMDASHIEQNITTDHNDSNPLNSTSTLKARNEISLQAHKQSNKSRGFHSDTVKKEVDIHKGYKLYHRDLRKVKQKALQWLMDSRDNDYGWGEETARAMIALWMSDYAFEKSHNVIVLMSKQLHLELFALMSRNDTKPIPLSELALYINALSASCDNPKNFHGHDLVDILRHRTNAAQVSVKFVTPFVYLVLCFNNVTSYVDVIKVREMLYDSSFNRGDTKALIILAATCISRIPQFSTVGIGQIAAKKLYNEITARGLPRNIYELALTTQALNEARIDQDLWNRKEAMRRIIDSQENGSFGDILSTYYVLPTLSGKSFLSIGENCPQKDTELAPLAVLRNGKDEEMYIHYSLRFGNPLEKSLSIMIKVLKNTSFLNIMRIAATLNPAYKFKYDVTNDMLTVYSIGGIANDAERGLYWTPYTSRNSSRELMPFEGDIRSFIPVLGEYIAFWRKPLI